MSNPSFSQVRQLYSCSQNLSNTCFDINYAKLHMGNLRGSSDAKAMQAEMVMQLYYDYLTACRKKFQQGKYTKWKTKKK